VAKIASKDFTEDLKNLTKPQKKYQQKIAIDNHG
jgi:hypothetical protein